MPGAVGVVVSVSVEVGPLNGWLCEPSAPTAPACARVSGWYANVIDA
jgi:hypothetical protein